MLVDVRRAEPAEWKLVREIRLIALQDAPDAFGSTYARELSLTEADWLARFTNCAWFLAWSNDEPVGIAAGLGTRDAGRERELVSMWVRADHRGQGVATELVAAVRARAKADDAKVLRLWVADGNARARRFYERLGFVPTGTRRPRPHRPEIGEEELSCPL